MAVQLVLGIISTIVLLILLIRTRMQDRSFRFTFVLLFLMGMLVVGLSACETVDNPPPSPFTGSGSNIPPATMPPSSHLQISPPCDALGQNCIWAIIFDGSVSGTQLDNGSQVNDPVNTHYIVVHFTFTNNSPYIQELETGQDIYLQGSDGQSYYEDQASNQSVIQFDSGQTQEVYLTYVVPDSVCNYTLVVTAFYGTIPRTWSITVTASNYCHT